MAAALLPADWPAPRGVHGFTTLRCGAGVSAPPFDRFNMGSRCGDAVEAVAHNRAELVELGGLPSAPLWLRQVHGATVFRAGRGPAGPDEPEADAAVTSVPGTVLAILTADCLPVLFCADDGSEVAAAHAGWRGLLGGVLTLMILALRRLPLSPLLARYHWLERLHDNKSGVPYGIALALAGMLTYTNSAIFERLAV